MISQAFVLQSFKGRCHDKATLHSIRPSVCLCPVAGAVSDSFARWLHGLPRCYRTVTVPGAEMVAVGRYWLFHAS